MNLTTIALSLNKNYRLLNTDIAQQTMKVVDCSIGSFLGILKAIKSWTYTQKAQIPRYLPQDGYFPLIIPRIRVRDDGTLAVPMSQQFKREYREVRIHFPERLKDKNIKEVRIHPKYNRRWFEIEYIYQDEIVKTS